MSIQRARELRLGGQYAEAVELLHTLPNQNDITILREQIMNYFQLRQIDKLIETTRRIQTVDMVYEVEALAHCGLLLRGLGNRAAAIEYFRAAVDAHKKGSGWMPDWMYSEFSGVLIDQRDWSQALAVATVGATVKPVLSLTVAHSQIRLGDFKAARDWLRLFMGIPAHERASHNVFLRLATEIWMHDDDEETRRWILQSPITVSDHNAPHLAIADLAVTSGKHTAAATLWLQVAAEHQSLRPFVTRQIERLVRSQPELVAHYCPVFEGLISLDPTNPPAVHAYYEYLLGSLSREDAIVSLLNFQLRMPRLMPALAVELVRWGFEEKLRELAAHHLETWVSSIEYTQCSRFLDAICRFQPLEIELLESIRSMAHCTLQLFLLFRVARLKAVKLWESTESDEASLRDAGIDVLPIRRFVDGMTRLAPNYDAYLETADISCAAARKKIRDEERFVAFQDLIVREKNFSVIDPTSGRKAALFDSLKIFDRQIFGFVGAELVLVISGGNMNAITSIYMPGGNVLLPIEAQNLKCSQNYYGSQIHMAELLAVYLSRVARSYDEFRAAAVLAPQREGVPRKIVAIQGRAENPAHHSWNYLSAFERLNMSGLLGNIDAIVRPPTEYFGDVRRMFPELGSVEMLEMPERPAIDPRPFSVDHVVIQLGGNFITRQLKRRLQNWAFSEISPQRRIDIENSVRRGRALIWLGLRVGDKVWVRQESGLIAVINEVCEKFPGTVFLLDGFSVTRDGDAVPEKWSAAFRELGEIARRIRRAVSDPAALIDMVGGALADSLVYATYATMYLTPMGSSQHKVGWYSDCPGIVYTSAKFAGRVPELLPGAWEAEGSAVPSYVFGSVSAAGKKRGHFDFRSDLENIDMPIEMIGNRVLDLLTTCRSAG